MSKFNKMYREFFGLREQDDKEKYGADALKNLQAYNAELEKTKELMGEDELAEADLVNNITDYQGGVVYKIIDPTEAKNVYNKIKTWTAKKGFDLIKSKKLADNKFFVYFRLGEDPATEAQKINGYFAQLPELDKFKFKVISENPDTPKINVSKRPQGKI